MDDSRVFNFDHGYSSSSDSITDDQDVPEGKKRSRLLFEFRAYKKLNEATDIGDLTKKVSEITESLGFSSFTYTHTQLELHRGLISIEKDLMDDYDKGGFLKYDMIAGYIRGDCEKGEAPPIYNSVFKDYVFSAPFRSDLILQNREMFQMVRRYGYRDVYIIPVKSTIGKGNCVLTVENKGEKPLDFRHKVEKEKWKLGVLPQMIEYVGGRKFPGSFWQVAESQAFKVRPRSLALLKVLGEDDLPSRSAFTQPINTLRRPERHLAQQQHGARSIVPQRRG